MLAGDKKIELHAARAEAMLVELTATIKEQSEELNLPPFTKHYSKTALYSFPNLSKAIVNKTVEEMENEGYAFARRGGNNNIYDITLEDVIALYEFRNEPKYRDKHQEALCALIGNLKGGVSKTVTSVNLAQALRTHDQLLKEDLRIIILDLDPQASATMFLKSTKAIGDVDYSAVQAMLQNVDFDTLKKDYIVSSAVSGVDLIPASIDDSFIASRWDDIVAEHLPGQNKHKVLLENLVDKLKPHYDFIFIDTGPHLDPFLQNSIYAADVLMTPIPPATVDFHSTLRYLQRIPELKQELADEDAPTSHLDNIGFMTKIAKKSDHELTKSLAKDVLGSSILDCSLPRNDAFERCGETFDTVISARKDTYEGSIQTLNNGKKFTYDFAKAVFDRIENLRKGAY